MARTEMEPDYRKQFSRLNRAGLEALCINKNGYLFEGGRKVTEDPDRPGELEIEEPAFVVFTKKNLLTPNKYYAAIRDMNSEYPRDLVKRCRTLDEAVDFLCNKRLEQISQMELV